MNFSNQPAEPAFEARLEAWLTARPILPSPDFVERTLERVRAEGSLASAAWAGDDAALDSLLDHWLADQPLEPSFEPELLASRTRGTRTEREREEAAPGKRWLVFPAWLHSVGALAAAAAIVLLGFFDTRVSLAPAVVGSAAQISPRHLDVPGPVAVVTGRPSAPAASQYASNPAADEDLLSLHESLRDGAALLNADNVDLLSSATQDDDAQAY
jgi:hypothetical protein